MLTSRPTRSRPASKAAAGAAVAVALLAGAGLLTAAPAQADPRPCPGAGAGDPARCAQVIGIKAGSSLVMRTEPRYGAAQVARFGNGQWLELDCWTTGAPDADGHGYRYWMQVSTASRNGYVNDRYLDSGGPATWKSQIRHCRRNARGQGPLRPTPAYTQYSEGLSGIWSPGSGRHRGT